MRRTWVGPRLISDRILADLVALDLSEDERDANTDAVWAAFNDGVNAERERASNASDPSKDKRG